LRIKRVKKGWEEIKGDYEVYKTKASKLPLSIKCGVDRRVRIDRDVARQLYIREDGDA
jgi:hypothetical protein